MRTIEHQDGSRFWVLPSGVITYQRTPESQPIPLAQHVAEQAEALASRQPNRAEGK